MMYRRLVAPLTILTILTAPWITLAAERQETRSIQTTVEDFVTRETAGLPGRITISVGTVDNRLHLISCAQMQAFLPPGGKLWGNSSVGVRCSGANPWTVYVPVVVKVSGNYLATARPLAPGQVLGQTDMMTLNGDLTQMPPGILTDPAQAVGKSIIMRLTGGQPLRQEWLRAPILVQPNQVVKLFTQGTGFKVTSEGRALAAASEGQTLQVRTASGHVVSGTVRAGAAVEVAF